MKCYSNCACYSPMLTGYSAPSLFFLPLTMNVSFFLIFTPYFSPSSPIFQCPLLCLLHEMIPSCLTQEILKTFQASSTNKARSRHKQSSNFHLAGNSEDARSVDLSLRSDNEERGFYTENFHSAAWVFRGDDVSPDNSPRCLSKRNRPVASKYSQVISNKCQ